LEHTLIPKWQEWLDIQTRRPPTEGPTPIAGLTPQAPPNVPQYGTPGDTGEVAIAEATGARTGEAWGRGYFAGVTETASGEKITGVLLIDPSAMNQQGAIAGGAMGTALDEKLTETLEHGSPSAFGPIESGWTDTLTRMRAETNARRDPFGLEAAAQADESANLLVAFWSERAPELANEFRGRFSAAMGDGLLTPATAAAITDDLETQLVTRFGPASVVAVHTFATQLQEQAERESAFSAAGAAAGAGVAAGLEGQAETVAQASNRMMAGAKSNISKAIAEGAAEGNQLAVQSLLTLQAGMDVIKQATDGLTAARKAEVLVMLDQQGAQATLLH
ncbi:MAG: hypothetical protein ACREMY_34685, partial [bacterium]